MFYISFNKLIIYMISFLMPLIYGLKAVFGQYIETKTNKKSSDYNRLLFLL